MENRRLLLRTGIVILILILSLFIFGMKLYELQIVEGDSYYLQGKTVTQTETIPAARGTILDRYGRVLVTNKAGYNITINSTPLFNSGRTNEVITELLEKCDSMGIGHIDTLPINEDGTAYLFEEMDSAYEWYFRQYLTEMKWDKDISAENIYILMRKYYKIPDDVSDIQARDLIGVRYELTLRIVVGMDAYIFAEDVALDDLAIIKEQGFPGVEVVSVTYRQYNTNYAAHLLGTVGPMDKDEYAELKDDYAMNAVVGKDGIEKAFESLLRGIDGKKVVSIDDSGKAADEYVTVEPVPGQNVYLTIDIVMQEIAERSLESCILSLRADTASEGSDARGGAVVVMDVNSFEVLTIASYPSYNITTFNADYNGLLADEYNPLYDRSLLATYSPGSIFKMVSTVAAIDTKKLDNPLTEIVDEGRYTRYKDYDYQPVCNFYKNTSLTHGSINVMQALAVSCNYFFYEVGYMVGLNKLERYAQSFGLGELTGIEVYENIGTRAGADDSVEWFAADTLSAAIGQSENKFTPLQMCCYISTLANGGTRYNAHLLSKAVTNDYQIVTQAGAHEVLGTAMMSETALETAKTGMLMASRSADGTARETFGSYDIDVCAKTGTVEHGSGGSDHASFACFAPYDNPEIAVIVYVENGARGGRIATVAKDILDYYFNTDNIMEVFQNENVLLK